MKWACAIQNQPNDPWSQQRLRYARAPTQSDQSSLCTLKVGIKVANLHQPPILLLSRGNTIGYVGLVIHEFHANHYNLEQVNKHANRNKHSLKSFHTCIVNNNAFETCMKLHFKIFLIKIVFNSGFNTCTSQYSVLTINNEKTLECITHPKWSGQTL